MVHQLSCPHCGEPLYFADATESDEDFQEALCLCQMVFVMRQVDVIGFSAKLAHNPLGESQRHYAIAATNLSGETIQLNFSRPISEPPLLSGPKDTLLLMYSVCRDEPDTLVCVKSASNDRTLELAPMHWRSLRRGSRAGLLSGVAGAMLCLPLGSGGEPLYWLATAAVSVTVGLLGVRNDRLRLHDRARIARLDAEQHLLQQQSEVERKQSYYDRHLQQQQRLLRRLKALQFRMQEADPALYARRIKVLGRGIDTLQESTGLTQSLRNGYKQLAKMLAIEYETSRLAEQLPQDGTQHILQRLGDLEQLEDRRSHLETLVDPQLLLQEI
ncbi:hypothetical protein [Synechococcus sp. PCC 7336]|uniref:hypothetical protein n=1 Tax=Synechococcus sp. PCC 7336 TaxID=195250 RepID=UPI00034B26F4|nr:hypothetical protein [Synechococcus sp. PCC 7336]